MGFGIGSVWKSIKKVTKGVGNVAGGIVDGYTDVFDATYGKVGEFYVDAYGEIVETVGKTVGDFVDSTVTTVKAAAEGDPMAIAAVGLMVYGGYSMYAAMSAGAAGSGAAAAGSSVGTGSTAVATGSASTGAASGSAAAAGGSAGASAGAASAAGSAGGAAAAGSTAGTVAATEAAKQITLEQVFTKVASDALVSFGVQTAISAIAGTPDVDIPEQEFVRPDEVFDVYGRTSTGTSERSASVSGVTAGGDFKNTASIGRV